MPDIILHQDKHPVFSTSTESENLACVRRERLDSLIKKELHMHERKRGDLAIVFLWESGCEAIMKNHEEFRNK